MFLTDNLLKDVGIKKLGKNVKSDEVILEEFDEEEDASSNAYKLIETDNTNPDSCEDNESLCFLEQGDLDLNERNFNIIKNSKAFKSKIKEEYFEIIDEDENNNNSIS